jgi:regulatory protein
MQSPPRARRSPRLPPRLTGLRRARPGRLVLEVDGEPWRTVPDEVVVRCGLAAGIELERPLLRRLRRELRRSEALALAGRALTHAELTERRLEERLRRRRVPPALATAAVATLAEAGFVDDRRLARGRARALAERGWGDAAVEARLVQAGVAEGEARAAVAELDPEPERAAALASTSGDRRKAWALLARRGFSEETIAAVVGTLDGEA